MANEITQHSALSTQHSAKRGFTLVELSIVLVIIGLLIGGILVGQSLIESTKVNRFISDLLQYEVAVKQFHLKFKSYPGDYPYFIPGGDNNSWFAGSGCDATYTNLSNNEAFQFWAHLSQSKMLSVDYPAYSPQSCGGPHNNIISNNQNIEIWPYTELHKSAASAFGISKAPILAHKNNSNSNLYLSFSPKPLEVLMIENKLGSQNYTGTHKQIGLVNQYGGVGQCFSGSLVFVPCSNANAVFTNLFYYLAP